ncbi:MAG: FAD-binding oxidoreductase [Alteromonadaceae bacterium]|nr:FAD-binding oxidoreductase [Alteromonadaceae bacterium]
MSEILQKLKAIVGNDNLLTDELSRQLYVTDVFTRGLPALAIVRPTTKEQLGAIVKTAVDADIPVVPRGGGMSYTSGYVPKYKNSIMIDMVNMNQVVDINTQDMYVTVEAGCSWKKLHEALQSSGYRTPFWGTLSGIHATVGGGLSQNSIFWGSALHGPAADSVVSMSVVLADGSVVDTGSASHKNATPWHRHFGPDLTGIFVGDGGALGFKATVTLKLIPDTPARRGVSFAVETGDTLLAFVSEVSRQQLASEVCGFDPFLQNQRLKRESLGKDLKALGGVMKSAGSIGKALKAGTKVALAGRGYMKEVKFSVHIWIEERYEELADLKQQSVLKLASEFGLREIENSIPTIMRANPFGPVNSMIGPQAERWLPVHCVAPHSIVRDVYKAIDEMYERNRVKIEQFNVGCGFLFATVGNNATVIEPVFFWPETLNELHRYAVEKEHLRKLKEYPANPEATAFIHQLRRELIDIFTRFGTVHMQLGKSYPYDEQIKPEAWTLVEALKQHVDPKGLLNPGTLGLEAK